MPGNDRVLPVTTENEISAARSPCAATAGISDTNGTIRYREFCAASAGVSGPGGPSRVALLLWLNCPDTPDPGPGTCLRGDDMHDGAGQAAGLGDYIEMATASGIRFACLRSDDAWVGWDCSAPLIALRLRASVRRVADLAEQAREARASLTSLGAHRATVREEIRRDARVTFGFIHRAAEKERRTLGGVAEWLDDTLGRASQGAGNLELPQYRLNRLARIPREVARDLGLAHNWLATATPAYEGAARTLPGQRAWFERPEWIVACIEAALDEASAAVQLLVHAREAAEQSVRLQRRRAAELRRLSREGAAHAYERLNVALLNAATAGAAHGSCEYLKAAAHSADRARGPRSRNIELLRARVSHALDDTEQATRVVRLDLIAALEAARAAGPAVRTEAMKGQVQ